MEYDTGKYILSDKLKFLASFPVEKSPSRLSVSSYNVEQTVSALRQLGFDLSRVRKQGVEIVTSSESGGKVFIGSSWFSYSREDVFSGTTEIYINQMVNARKIINPCYANPARSILRPHEWARYNSLTGKRFPFLPDNICSVINRIHHKGIGLSQSGYSKCVMFDIDSHDYLNISSGMARADKTLQKLYEELNYHGEIFIERSLSGGYHVAFETDSVVNEKEIGRFVQYFEDKHGLQIEARTSSKIFRCPGHFTYSPGFTLVNDQEVKFQGFENPFSWKDHVLASENIVPFKLFCKKAKPIVVIKPATYSRPGRQQVTGELKLVAGNRDKVMWKLALIMKNSGKGFNDYLSKLYESQVSSKDWAAWSAPVREAEAKRCWDNVKTSYKIWNGEFISGEKLLPQRVKAMLRNPRVISYFNPDSNSPYHRVRERSSRDTFHILTELISKCIHYETRPRSINAPSPTMRAHLACGYQFPRLFIDRMSSHYNMKASARRIVLHILTKSHLFKPYSWDGIKGRYSSGTTSFCRQWVCDGNIADAFIALCRMLITYSNQHSTTGLHMCEVLYRPEIIHDIVCLSYPPG